ncbi:hypothetical protein L596_018403 [Steinernema carpocapsae]|uniref:Uncharacterized protein n=1 Tax=Steinernema carpocapsae TaxID=34508 RepID=A0A4U5N4T7_STECR|nr:hypothetical protein L596_018403 [Steinernema carpocapsae]
MPSDRGIRGWKRDSPRFGGIPKRRSPPPDTVGGPNIAENRIRWSQHAHLTIMFVCKSRRSRSCSHYHSQSITVPWCSG